jgi:hypothetical protein
VDHLVDAVQLARDLGQTLGALGDVGSMLLSSFSSFVIAA